MYSNDYNLYLRQQYAKMDENMMLDELFVSGDQKNYQYIISIGSKVFLFNDNDFQRTEDGSPNKVETTLNEVFKEIGEKEERLHFDEWWDLVSYLRDYIERPDIVAATVENKVMSLAETGQFVLDPKSSIQVKKIVDTLGIKKVLYPDSLEGDVAQVTKKKVTGDIPEIFYHGTSTLYLPKIAQIGLRPAQSPTNYKNIEHEDAIFFTSRFGEAMHHAAHTANKTKSKPVVISFTIGDENLLIPDYDVDTSSGQTHYQDVRSQVSPNYVKPWGNKKSMSMSREVGVYGYKGVIMPSWIQSIWISSKDEVYNLDDFTKMSLKKALKLIDQGYF